MSQSSMLSQWASDLAPIALGVFWQGTVLALIVLLAYRFVPRIAPGLAHGLLFLAVVKFLIPPIVQVPMPVPSGPLETAPGPSSIDPLSSPTQNPLAEIPPALGHDAIAPAATADADFSWGALALLVGSIGSLGFLVAWVRGLRQLRRHCRQATRITDGPLHDTLTTLVWEAGSQRTPRLLLSNRQMAPQAFGWFRPTILVPADAVHWSPSRRRVVLGHEWIHLRRLDPWTGMAATVCLGLWWFHPVVWALARSLRRVREDAVDDEMLSRGWASPEDYCQVLLHSARDYRAAHATSLAMAMVVPPQTSEAHDSMVRRFRRIMDSTLVRKRAMSFRAKALGIVLALIVVPNLGAQDSTKKDEALATLHEVRSTLETLAGREESKAKVEELSRLAQKVQDVIDGLGTPATKSADLEGLRSTDPSVRFMTVDTLAANGKKDATPSLIPLLGDKDPFVRLRVLQALCELEAKDWAHALIPCLDDETVVVREQALESLITLTGRKNLRYDVRSTAHQRTAGRALWEESLGVGKMSTMQDSDKKAPQGSDPENAGQGKGPDKDSVTTDPIDPELNSLPEKMRASVESLTHADAQVRWRALDELWGFRGAVTNEKLGTIVVPLIHDHDPFVQLRALRLLRQLGARGVAHQIPKELRDSDPIVRSEALEALITLSGRTDLRFDVRSKAAERESFIVAWEEWAKNAQKKAQSN